MVPTAIDPTTLRASASVFKEFGCFRHQVLLRGGGAG